MHLTLSLLLTGALTVSASLAPPAHLHRSSHRDLSIHPHYSHPRPRFVEVGGGARALPRAGRRLNKRDSGAQATVKCLTAYTFALCDENDCTDMGSVAAGTMCKDGAITWDTADEASSDDSSSSSSAAQSEVESTSATIAEAAVSPSPSSSSSSIVLHNAAVNTATKSSSSAAPTTTSAPAAETSSSDYEDGEGDCEEEDQSSDDGWTSTTSQAPKANYATSSSTSDYVAPTTTSTSEYKAPTSSSTTQYVAPTTTTTTTQAAATTSSSSSGSGATSEVFTGGRGTFYYQYGAYGACGQIHADSDPIVALAIARYGTGSNNAPDCGRTVVVTNVANGKSVTATVADACPGCANYNSLDLSTGAFDQIADEATGVIDISWYFSS